LRLAEIAHERLSGATSYDRFSDLIQTLLDDVAGFEIASSRARQTVTQQIWRLFMNAAAVTKPTEPNKGPINKDAYKAAISSGKAMLKEGKTKAEVAQAIYGQLKGESRETVITAFVDGASLTEKGAVTYWYNCRRKVAKKPTKES